MEVWPGVAYPLGASYDGKGVNFAVFSSKAEMVELCLFDPDDPKREILRAPMADLTGHVFHSFVPGLSPGALYGYRVKGPYAPEKGLRCDPSKLLTDPYAKALSG